MANLPTTITTPKFRVSYPCVFKPQLNKLSGKEEYSLQAIFDKDADLSGMMTCLENACINKWGSDKKKWPRNIRSPFKDQKELIDAAKLKERDHSHLTAGAKYITFKCSAKNAKTGAANEAPKIVGKNPKEQITEESKFYGGCYARANVNAGAYDKGGNAGISFYLNAAQFMEDGQAFGGKPNVESAFEAIPEDESEDSSDSIFN